MIANDLIKKLGLDEFIFIPTGISVTEKNLTPAKHRLQMINLALTNKKMKVSTFEVEESLDSKKSFTFDTLKYFFKKNNYCRRRQKKNHHQQKQQFLRILQE